MVFQPPCWFKKHHWLGQPIKTLTVDVLTFDVQIAVKWLCIGIVHEGIRYWWYKHTMYVYSSYLYDFFARQKCRTLSDCLFLNRFTFFFYSGKFIWESCTSMFIFLLHPCSFLLYHMCGTGWYIFFFVGSWYLYSTSCLSTCWVNQFSPEILGRSLRVKLIQSCIPWTLPIFRSGFKKCAVYWRVHYVDVHVYRPVYNHNI